MTILADKERKARKEHHCSLCSGIIRKGEVYSWTKTIQDRMVYDLKCHKKCSFLCAQLWDYAEADADGMDADTFTEALHDFCIQFVCPDCEKWDHECRCCNDDLAYCLDKAYNLLRIYVLCQTRRSWCGVDWGLVPRTAEERRRLNE